MIPAPRFSRIVTALSSQFIDGLDVGAEWPFMVGYNAEVIAWVPRTGYLTMQLGEVDGPRTATVTVCPGEYRAFDVIAERVCLGETRTVEAAFSIALDYLSEKM